MALDPRIAMGVQPLQVESPVNQLAKVLQIQGMQDDSAMNRMKAQEYQRSMGETKTLNALYQGAVGADGQIDRNALYQGAAQQGIGSKIPALQKQFMETDEAKAKLDKQTLDAAKVRTELAGQAFGSVRAAPTIENAHAALDFLGQRGVFKPEEVALMKSKVTPDNVGQFADQMFRMSLGAKDQLAKYETKNTGAQTITQSTDPVSGKTSTVNTLQNTVSPDAQLHANVSRQNNKDTIAGENMRSGVAPDGKMDENSERTAQAIASGQLPAPTGMALLNPKNQRILGRVMEINPQYDATTVAAKKAAATAFTTGKEGAMMRSLQVAGQHLEQLDTLIDAMNNGNVPLVNKISNTFSQQTGNPAVTNFDAAKEVVSKEVMKAIVAGGGGVGEREELARSLANAKSLAQLKGVTKQYRNLMGAQHEALLQQRDAAGLPRSTLPNYREGGAAPAVPAGWGIEKVN